MLSIQAKEIAKRALSTFLMLSMIFGLTFLSVDVQAADAVDVDSIKTNLASTEFLDDVFTSGQGTSSNPYEIKSETDLISLQLISNNQASSDLYDEFAHGKYFKLTTDISLTADWTPIANGSAYYFAGSFDGDGHTISGLNMTAEAAAGETAYGGLFGYTDGATISNLNVTGSVSVSLTADDENTDSSAIYAGGIVGCAVDTTVTDCAVNVTVKAANAATGTVNMVAGGAVGYLGVSSAETSASVTNVSAQSGTYVSATTSTHGDAILTLAGGVVGLAHGSDVSGCTSAASVVVNGSKTLYQTGTYTTYGQFYNSQADGTSTNEGTGYYNLNEYHYSNTAGGVVGAAVSVYTLATSSSGAGAGATTGITYTLDKETTVTNCTSEAIVINETESNLSFAGGVVGTSQFATVSGCSLSSGGQVSGAYAGGVLGVIAGDNTVSNCTASGAVTGTASAGGIAGQLGGHVFSRSGNQGSDSATFAESTLANCTASGTVTCSDGYAGGIVGYMTYADSISGSSNGATVSGSNAGGILGGVYNSYSSSGVAPTTGGATYSISVSSNAVTDCYNSGTVSGSVSAGGIAGYAANPCTTISGCSNSGTVSGTGTYAGGVVAYYYGVPDYSDSLVRNVSNSANVTGSATYAGGVIGYLDGNITNVSYYSVALTNAYNNGAVVGGSYAGGVVGYAVYGMSNCYNSGAVTGSTAGGIAGVTRNSKTEITDSYALSGSESQLVGYDQGGSVIEDVSFFDGAQALTTDSAGYGTLLVALNAFVAENSTNDVSLNWWGISSTYPGFTDTVMEPTTTVSAPVVSYTVNGESSENATANIGDTLTLSIDAVTAEDGETVHYQWYSSTSSSESTRSKIDGANGLTYTVDTTKSANVYYWIAVSVQNDYMRTAEVFNDAAIETIVAFAVKEDGTIDGGTFEIKLKDTANTENSESNPYVIDTVEKLQALSAFMSDKTTAYYFEQYGDLDLGDEAWTPIGTSSNPFIGVYDGANYQVSGLYISDTPESTATYYGLFGYINSATIKNLTVSGEITLGQSSSGSYYGYAGALVGRLYSNSSITDCAVTEDTTISGGQYTGGIAGQVSYSLSAPNSLSNCTSAASVYGGNYAGGITGLSSSYNTFADISNSGTVTSATGPAGGLIGSAGYGNISNSSNTGTVYSTDTAGGLIGTTTQSTFEVLNSKNFGEVTGGTYVGGLVGNLIANIVNSYNQGNVVGLSGATAVGGLTGNSSRAIRNCYNVGEVSTAGGDTVFGSLSGLNASNVTNCFYLTQSGVDALGTDSGAVSYVASFNDANGVLTALDAEAGFAYPGTSLLEQLNGWVANNLSDYSDAMGWTADDGSYPILSNDVDLTGEIPATVTVTMSEENPSKVSMGSEMTLTATVTLSDGAIGTVTYQWLRGDEEISVGIFETTAETVEIPASISVETSTFGSYSYTLKVTNTTQTYVVSKSGSATASIIVDKSADADPTVWYGYEIEDVADSFAGGDGTADSPYQIAQADQLAYMAQQINSGKSKSAYYELAADLNLNGYDWTVIGNSSTYAFTGTFEGNGHTISGLYMDDGSIAGLFGYLGSNATVQNLNISGDVTGSSGAAGLLASQMTTKSSGIQISNVTVSGTVMVRDASYSTSAPFSGSAGGLIGAARTSSVTLTECKNEATVGNDGSGTTVLGGLIGSVLLGGEYTVTVECCCNLGEITSHAYAGGLIGGTYLTSSKNGVLTVSDCYNLGSVTGSFAGGIIGYRGSATYSGTQTVSNCYNASAISDASGYSCVLGAEKSGTELTTYSNCYYLSGSNNGGTAVERDGITKVDVLSASSLGENFTDSTETIGTITFSADDYATVKVGDAMVESASANGYPYLSWQGNSPVSRGYVAFQVSMTDPYVISAVTAENGVILTDSLEDKTFLAVVTGNDTVTIDGVLPTTLTVTGDNATFAFVSGFYETTDTEGQYTVGQNTTVTFTVEAASDYAVTSVSSVSGTEGAVQELMADEDGVYTLSIDAESVTVSIVAEPTYTFYYVLTNAAKPEILSGSATLGGSLAAPTIKVINGDTVTFSTTPDSGYVLTLNSVAFTVTKTDAETSEQYEYTAQTLTVDDSGVYSLTVSELLADGETALAGSTMNIVAEAASLAVDSAADLTFTGSEITPDVVVTVDGDVLSAEYYSLSYSDNIDVGTASVTATLQNGYVGTLTGTFSIEKKELTEDDFAVPETADYNYGAAVEVEIVSGLELDVDYTVRYDNNIDAGTNAKVTISGKGNYGGTLTYKFAIVAAELSSDAVTIEVTGELSYTGEDVRPAVKVMIGESELTEDTDYTVVYGDETTDFVSAGSVVNVTVTFQGNYSGTATATYTIAKADQTLTVNHATQELPVSASKNLATLNLVSGNQTELVYGLAEGEGFTLDGSILTTPETEKAEATITIYAAEGDNYNASEPVAVTVTTVNKAEVSVTFESGAATYTGEALTYEAASVEVEETDGTWTYVYYDADGTKLDSAPTDAGTYTVTATYTSGDSTGTASTNFTIEPQPVEATVALTDTSTVYTYTGNAIEPDVEITVDGAVLTEDTVYTYEISYADNVNASTEESTATVTVTFTGNYSGEASTTFTIEARTLTADDFALESDSVVYDGTEQKPVVILADGLNLTEGTDYSIEYANNTDVGTATVTITGLEPNCTTGSAELTFTFEITGSDVSENVTVTVADGSYVYTGEAIEPEVTVTRDESVLTEGEDYTVTYSNNINASTEESKATVTVTLTGNYSGTVLTESFTIEKAEQTLVMRNDGTIIAEIGETLDLTTLIEDSSSYAGTLLFGYQPGNVNLIGTGNTVLNIISELEAGTELELTVYALGTTNYEASKTVTFTVTAVARTSITIDSDNADVVVYERTTATDEDGEVQTVDTLLSADAETGTYSAKQGMTISFTVTPESGYGLPNVTVNGETVEPDENGYYVVELTAELLAEDSDLVISVSVKRTSWDESSGDTADADIESIIASVAAGTQTEDADGSTYEDSLDYNDDGKNDLLDILNILYRTEEQDTDSMNETVEEAVSEDATEDATETSDEASEDASDEASDESSGEATAESDADSADDSGADSETASEDAAE